MHQQSTDEQKMLDYSEGSCFLEFLKESFGPRKENSLKGPLLNHLTSEKTKHNFSSILMLRASCIYWRRNS